MDKLLLRITLEKGMPIEKEQSPYEADDSTPSLTPDEIETVPITQISRRSCDDNHSNNVLISVTAERNNQISPKPFKWSLRVKPTSTPVTLTPVTLEPVTLEPVTLEPVTLKPAELEPVTLEPLIVKPITLAPVSLEPVVLKPHTLHPPTLKPVVLEPVSSRTSVKLRDLNSNRESHSITLLGETFHLSTSEKLNSFSNLRTEREVTPSREESDFTPLNSCVESDEASQRSYSSRSLHSFCDNFVDELLFRISVEKPAPVSPKLKEKEATKHPDIRQTSSRQSPIVSDYAQTYSDIVIAFACRKRSDHKFLLNSTGPNPWSFGSNNLIIRT